MPALRFRASDSTLLTFARADAWPRVPDADEGQMSSMSTTGLMRVATLRPPITMLTLNFAGKTSMLQSDYVALKAFLSLAVVKLKAFPFTLVDVDNTETLVRYMSGLYKFQQTTPLLRQGSLLLRIEPT